MNGAQLCKRIAQSLARPNCVLRSQQQHRCFINKPVAKSNPHRSSWVFTRHAQHSTIHARRLPVAKALATGSRGVIQPMELTSSSLKESDSVLIWYKNDLRTDDHAGLVAAAQAGVQHLTALYVLDPQLLAPLLFLPGAIEALVAALAELQRQLQGLGSELVVRMGHAEDVVPEVAQAVGATVLVAGRELEHRWKQSAVAVFSAILAAGVRTNVWASTIWTQDGFDFNYRRWKNGPRGKPAAPLDQPRSLPPVPARLDPGVIPGPEELRRYLQEHPASVYDHDELHKVAQTLKDAALISEEAARAARLAEAGQFEQHGTAVLKSYLGEKDNGIPSNSPLAIVAEEALKLEVPGAQGASFPALFGLALTLGVMSRRRVYAEASAKNNANARAAARSAELADFHWHLAEAAADLNRPKHAAGIAVRQWRWRGMLTEYCVADPPEGKAKAGAPAVMLVHGFGAFSDQWRGNMEALASAGYRVFAPTIPGFGRSEKGAAVYSQDTWRNFLRDFVLQVVRAPVVLAGNSIGGFISTCMAADYPSLVRGLVLLNSAGPIDENFSMEAWKAAAAAKKPPPRFIVEAVSRGLFWYLERTIPGTLKWLYPAAPVRADTWLAEEIYRAACDEGSLEVFQAVFYLPPPRALNYMINHHWKGPTLVLQGANDPLNDAKGRAAQLAALCPNYVSVVLVEAGHCPHDEVPEQVNRNLLEFIENKCSQ